MGKVVRITESELKNLIQNIINENLDISNIQNMEINGYQPLPNGIPIKYQIKNLIGFINKGWKVIQGQGTGKDIKQAEQAATNDAKSKTQIFLSTTPYAFQKTLPNGNIECVLFFISPKNEENKLIRE
jgi:hypothetical protein